MQARDQRNWLLENDGQLRNFLQSLSKEFNLVEAGESTQRVTYLDTFDWRIWRRGDVLEYHEIKRQKKLIWRRISHEKVYMEIPVDDCPDFINDIPDWLMPPVLYEVTKPRALVEQVLSRMQTRVYDIRDSNDKVIGRLSIAHEHQLKNNNRPGKALPMRLHAEPMRGYDKAFSGVLNLIEQTGLQGYGKDPLVQLLAIDERSPCDYTTRLRLQLQPGQRADEASRQVMLQLIQMMELNEYGIRDDIDTEFLRDYRYALQRVYSLLGQLKQVIPENTRQRFEDDLLWVEDRTSRLYELNNWLLEFENYRAMIDESQQLYLDELHGWLRTQRHAELVQVTQLMNSEEYQKFMKRWRVFLECEIPEHSVLKRAEQPVDKVAVRRIRKTYELLLKYKEKDLPRLLQIDLSKMNQVTSTLYDLLTLYSMLYPRKKALNMIKELRVFAEALSGCVARQRQIQVLRSLIRQMKQAGLQQEKTESAMAELLNCMLDHHSGCLRNLSVMFVDITSDETRKRYEKMYGKS
jgi:hypothetical protein